MCGLCRCRERRVLSLSAICFVLSDVNERDVEVNKCYKSSSLFMLSVLSWGCVVVVLACGSQCSMMYYVKMGEKTWGAVCGDGGETT